ncbi:arylamine N-acetyltransferase [Actinoplanes sp. NPDC049596]|uniref:arylamine N-acetyltransferase family protein n=1 Tax=unclassified Actinoplanes TaxID=2626549 RepID=UPI003417CCA8
MVIDVPGYLRRLGLDESVGYEPSVAALRAMHRAHAERVPYENLEIWLGRPTTVEPPESAERILRGRGGYCYHLNGAFSLLLRTIGYHVDRHFGGVQSRTAGTAGADGNHLVLTVSGLPSDEAPDGRWLVDLGMGDGLHEPLPLVPGTYRQGPFTYGLAPSEAEPGGWRFVHDPRGAFLGIDFRPEPVEMPAFADRHHHLSTSPESGFVRTAVVARRDATGADELRGLILTRVGDSSSRTELAGPDEYFGVLADRFGLTLDDVTPPERAALWQRLEQAHAKFVAGKAVR